MIAGYRDKKTQDFTEGRFVKSFEGFKDQAVRRLAVLNAATSLGDLRAMRSNRLEALSGNRQGQFSIRINNQWRLCFEWPNTATGPVNVEIVDNH